MSPADLARVLRAAAAACDALVAEASADRAEWIDQRQSPLGPRRHCRAVRRLVTEGSREAAIVGRRQLLSQAALTAELARPVTKQTVTKPSVADELRAELRLVGGGR